MKMNINLLEQYRYSNILKDKINAKYDAELEALEGDVTKNVGFENEKKQFLKTHLYTVQMMDTGLKREHLYEDATDIRVEVKAKRTNVEN